MGLRVGCRALALWQVVSLQGWQCNRVEAAFINGSWSWPRTAQCLLECLVWRIHQSYAMTPVAENVPSHPTWPPRCLLGGRQEPHRPRWKSAYLSSTAVGKLLYAGLWGSCGPSVSKVLSHYFQGS